MKIIKSSFFVTLLGVFFLLWPSDNLTAADGDSDIDSMRIGEFVSGVDFTSVEAFKGKVVILELWGLM